MTIRFNTKHLMAVLAATLTLASCSKDEVYESSVTRELSMTLDGKPWNIYYATSNRPLFIYNSDGSYFSNYSTSYRFSLPDGNYKVVATNNAINFMTPPTNLNDQIIEQDEETKQVLSFSDPIDYKAGDNLEIPIKTRTGMLRLKATDEKADRTYSTIKAVITTPVVAYHVGQAKPITTAEGLELVRVKETAGGGVGYSDDAVLIETNSIGEKVKLRIDYLDKDGNVVNSKPFADDFAVLANDTIEVSFALNNANEPVIINYNLRIASQSWSSSTIYPSVEINVPDGYTYVAPDENLDDVFKALAADDAVDEIKLFLRANASYTLADATVTGLTKPFSIVGQTPGFGQKATTLTVKNITMTGNISEMHFENLIIPSTSRLFYPRNMKFEIGEIAFINCQFPTWSNGSIWYTATNADMQQVVNRVVMDGCSFTNFTGGSNAIWNVATSRIAPIYNWTFKDCLFHGRNFGTKNVIATGFNKMTGDLSITVEGCKFIDTKGTAFSYFNIDGAKTSSTTLRVTNNIVSGVGATAKWFTLGKCDNVTATGNTRTSGYQMADYGVDTPVESSQSYQDLINQLNL